MPPQLVISPASSVIEQQGSPTAVPTWPWLVPCASGPSWVPLHAATQVTTFVPNTSPPLIGATVHFVELRLVGGIGGSRFPGGVVHWVFFRFILRCLVVFL